MEFSSDLDTTWLLIITVGVVPAMLLMIAVLAGLLHGVLSLDQTHTQVLARSGSPAQKAAAASLLPVLHRHHWMTASLVLLHAIVDEALPIVLGRVVNDFLAVSLSVPLVLLCGELLPTMICAGSTGMAWTARMTPVLWLAAAVTAPITWPVGRAMAWYHGHEHAGKGYHRGNLKTFLQLHTVTGGGGADGGGDSAPVSPFAHETMETPLLRGSRAEDMEFAPSDEASARSSPREPYDRFRPPSRLSVSDQPATPADGRGHRIHIPLDVPRVQLGHEHGHEWEKGRGHSQGHGPHAHGGHSHSGSIGEGSRNAKHRKGPSKEGPEAVGITVHEMTILEGTLSLTSHRVGERMIPFNKVFSLSTDTQLTPEVLHRIADTAHSRIPIHRGENTLHIAGVLLVKSLLRVLHVDGAALAALPGSLLSAPSFATSPPTPSVSETSNTYSGEAPALDRSLSSSRMLRRFPVVGDLPLLRPIVLHPSMSMLDALRVFRSQRSHMALVSEHTRDVERRMHADLPLREGQLLGLITLEDCLLALLNTHTAALSDAHDMTIVRETSRASLPSLPPPVPDALQ